MSDTVIYRGGRHVVICRDGKHYWHTPDGYEERIHGVGGTCATWAGGCPAAHPATAAQENER